MKKEFSVQRNAHPGKDIITLFIDGQFTSAELINDHETSGYCSRLENRGYVAIQP